MPTPEQLKNALTIYPRVLHWAEEQRQKFPADGIEAALDSEQVHIVWVRDQSIIAATVFPKAKIHRVPPLIGSVARVYPRVQFLLTVVESLNNLHEYLMSGIVASKIYDASIDLEF